MRPIGARARAEHETSIRGFTAHARTALERGDIEAALEALDAIDHGEDLHRRAHEGEIEETANELEF